MKAKAVQRVVTTVVVVLVGFCSSFSLNQINPMELQVQRPMLSLCCWKKVKESCGLAAFTLMLAFLLPPNSC